MSFSVTSKEEKIKKIALRVKEMGNLREDLLLNSNLPIYIKIDCVNKEEVFNKLNKPYDIRVNRAIIDATNYTLIKNDAKLAYCSGDSAHLVLFKCSETDYENVQPYKSLQDLISSTTSAFTARFNYELAKNKIDFDAVTMFQAQAWALPSLGESSDILFNAQVNNYKLAIDQALEYFIENVKVDELSMGQKIRLLKDYDVTSQDLPDFFMFGTFSSQVFVDTLVNEAHPLFKNQEIVLKPKANNFIINDMFNNIDNYEQMLFDPIILEHRRAEQRAKLLVKK